MVFLKIVIFTRRDVTTLFNRRRNDLFGRKIFTDLTILSATFDEAQYLPEMSLQGTLESISKCKHSILKVLLKSYSKLYM